MKLAKKLYCRGIQMGIRLAQPLLPYRKPLVRQKVQEVPAVLLAHSITRVLIVTGPNLYRMGALMPLEACLTEQGIGYVVYPKTSNNPTVQNVEEACALYRSEGCEGLIGFGGGSPMDCAKAVGARISNPKRSLARMRGALKVRHRLPFLVAIPTTAGTGSEISFAMVISDGEDKFPISDFTLIPRLAVLDADHTKTVPPPFAAAVGMDGLCHAVEAYLGRATTKETRSDAVRAIQLIFENIEAASFDPQAEDARKKMLEASFLAGNAFSQSYIGYVHAMAHALGGRYHLPHGLSCAVLLPHVLKAYGSKAHKKLHRLAIAIGVSKKNDTPSVGAERMIEAIGELHRRLGLPTALEELQPEDFSLIAEHAAREANPLYPVPKLMDAEELKEIYFKITKLQNGEQGCKKI